MDTNELLGHVKNFFSGLHKKKSPYNITVEIYTTSQFVTVQKGCTAFMFTCTGNDAGSLNGMRFNPSTTPATILGDSRSISAHKNDVYKGNLKLSFDGVGNAPALEIVQVFYMEEQ